MYTLYKTSKKELIEFVMKIDSDYVVKKTFIIYKTVMGYKVSVDQLRNEQRMEQTVSTFEFHAPMNIRDELFDRFKIYNDDFSGELAQQIHNFLLAIPGDRILFYGENKVNW